jgi:hypothetical protein
MTTRQHSLFNFLAAMVLGGCSATPARSAADGLDEPSCALDVPATLVTVHDTSRGAMVVFSNETDQVSALQRRVRALALLHGDPNHQNDPNVVQGAAAVAEFVVNGAQLRLTPRGDRALAKLRKDAREVAVRLANTPCRRDIVIPSFPPTYPVL